MSYKELVRSTGICNGIHAGRRDRDGDLSVGIGESSETNM